MPAELVRRVLREATLHRLIVPVLCGSALDHIGIQPLLDAVSYYLPSPADMPPVEGIDPQKKRRQASSASPRSTSRSAAWCSRFMADKHGDLHYVRIYSGRLKANSRVFNPGKDKKENVAAALAHPGRPPRAGSLGRGGRYRRRHRPAAFGHRRHALRRQPSRSCWNRSHFPETVISMAIEPESRLERKKLAEVLEMMKRQDPTFRAHENEETGQTIISGMGELHLEVIKHRLLRDFNLDVRVHKPRVSYKETVAAAAEAIGKCNRQIGGQTLFAEAKVRVTPRDDNKPAHVFTNWFSEATPVRNAIATLLSALKEHAEGGGLLGCPLWNCSIELLEYPLPEPIPTEVPLRIAAADAFNECWKRPESCCWSRSWRSKSPRPTTIWAT